MRFIETCVRVRKNAQIFGKRSAPSRKTPPQAYHEIRERNIRIEHRGSFQKNIKMLRRNALMIERDQCT